MPPQNGIPVDLKSLLLKWKLECILSHLVAEKIDIEVLEMMKLSHVRLLLQNFPLGIQIRFEYCMEQWREEIGKPLQSNTSDNQMPTFSVKNHIMKIEMDNKSTQTDLILSNACCVPQTFNTINKDAASDAICCPEVQIKEETTTKQLPSVLSVTPQQQQLPADEIDLLTILRNASYGFRLLTSYGLRQSFTDKERKLLIEAIVDHYIDNKKKFNVQISYALEQAILKMFPSENLNSYRTAKLGKIYITYASFRAKEKEKEQKKTEVITNGINNTNSQILGNQEIKEIIQITDEHVIIRTNSTDELDMNEVSQIDGGVNDESGMSDNTESIVLTIENSDDDDEERDENKTNTEQHINLDSAILIGKMLTNKRRRVEELDGPFTDFSIPWDKVPHNLITLLENRQQLGKHLNTFANLIVDELRKVSTKVPMCVLRAVSQQAIMKYPHSFLHKNAELNQKSLPNSALLSRLRNRNTFLNRQERQ